MISHIRTNIFRDIIRTVHNGIAAGVITLDGLGAASASLALTQAGQNSVYWINSGRQLPLVRSPAEAVGFLILK
jgi:hypothetical protein